MSRAPNPMTPAPAQRNSPLVVLAIRERRQLINRDFVAALLEEAANRGWRLLNLELTGGLIPGDQTPIGAITTWPPDNPNADRLRSLGCPVVRIGRLEHPKDQATPAVLPDHCAAGRLVAQYYAQRGFRDLVLVAQENMWMADRIYEGLEDEASKLHCTCRLYRFQHVPEDHNSPLSDAQRYTHRAAEITSWLADLPKPLAILCCQDFMAAQLCVMCQEAGLAVPEQVALLSYFNVPLVCDLAPVPVSAVDTDRPRLARLAFQLLDDLIAGKTVPPRTLTPPKGIVTRRSTDILAVDNPLVVRAIRFLWDNLDQNLCVDDVARHLNVPRFRLERAFRQHLHRGVNAELRRVRLERFCQLLQTTSLPIAALAPRVGFNSPEYLHNVFRKTFGISPRRYRLKAKGADVNND